MLDITASAYQGLSQLIKDDSVIDAAIDDDIAGEQESFAAGIPTLPETYGLDASARNLISAASQGVTDRTAEEYRRLAAQCEAYLHENNLIHPTDIFFSPAPLQDAPLLIVAWIMNACDEFNLDGSQHSLTTSRSTYNHATKMRAAMTFTFGRVHRLGKNAWHLSHVSGKMEGNPSLATDVSAYMLSLRRRKVQAGEAASSARAITPDIMRKLYDYNINQACQLQLQRQTNTDSMSHTQWAGPLFRKLLVFAYTLAFTCLLRIDELLKLQVQDIMLDNEQDPDCLTLVIKLPFRKTNQVGNIEPFIVTEFPNQMKHLCPVRACAAYFNATQIQEGYVFRRMMANDRIGEANNGMSAEQFLEAFRMNLLDIGVDFLPYGTHSFRRGGCQWMSVDLRWPLQQVCEWGGWSTEFSNLTIVKYLISANDSPAHSRKDFFDFNRHPTLKCHSCGRSCHCS